MSDHVQKMRFWCQKVIPLVYDDALSYYETVCKVVDYLNQVIEQSNSTADAVQYIVTNIGNIVGDYIETDDFKQLVDEKVQENMQELTDMIESWMTSAKRPLITNTNGAITNIMNIIGTYYHKSNLAYGNYGCAFNEEVTIDGDTRYIDCSTFAQLVVSGIAYENSRYVKSSNTGYGGFYVPVSDMEGLYVTDPLPTHNRPYGMTSDWRCRWAIDNGYFYDPDGDPFLVQPGDEIFLVVDGGRESSANVPVNHCGIVVGYNPLTENFIVIDANHVSQNRPYVISKTVFSKNQNPNYWIYGFAHYPYADTGFKPQDLLSNANNTINGHTVNLPLGGSADRARTFYTLCLSEPLKKNRAYTFVLKCSNITGPVSFYLQGSASKNTLAFTHYNDSDMYVGTFFINEYAEDFTYLSGINDEFTPYHYRLIASVPQGESYTINTYVEYLRLIDGYMPYAYGTDWIENNANTKYLSPLNLVTYTAYNTTESDTGFIDDIIARITRTPINVKVDHYCVVNVSNNNYNIPNGRYLISLIRFSNPNAQNRVNGVAKLFSLNSNVVGTLSLNAAATYPTDFTVD